MVEVIESDEPCIYNGCVKHAAFSNEYGSYCWYHWKLVLGYYKAVKWCKIMLPEYLRHNVRRR